MSTNLNCSDFMDWVIARNPGEPEFHHAVAEVAECLIPFINSNPEYEKARVLYRLTEPDRIISFRVTWEDDDGNIQINRGYRVQFSNAIGPYKGGIRFHPTVNTSILKFLGFEQIFKNSLTRLPMGGGKGGADFDPKGRSEREIMRFCQSFMTELYHYVGPYMDVPAGDIGVGEREVGYMFGRYKKLTNTFSGVMTGKGLEYGGSRMRTEATGYGAVYFLEDMLHHIDAAVEGKTAVISGAGNVAIHAAGKLILLGGKPVTLSDSRGFIHDPDGITCEKLEWVKRHKAKPGASIAAYTDLFGGTYHEGKKPWDVPCDVALPCATQDELIEENAKKLLGNGCCAVVEGANMPCTSGAIGAFRSAGILFGPGKAANAGGVGMSGLEMSQNAARLHRDEDDLRVSLRQIMTDIHIACVEHGARKDGPVDYVRGANVAGFKKVADAMLAFGVI